MAEKSKLDTAANIAILLTCAVAVFFLIRNQFFPPRPPGAPPEVEVGEQFDALRQVVPAGSDRALVIALSPTCGFCNESMPFYKRLVDQRNQAGSRVKIVAAVPKPPAKNPEAQKMAQAVQAEESQKLAEAGVKPDAIVPLDFASVKVNGTPTILLVDNQGKVLDVWVGKQPEDGEEEVLEAL